MIPNRIPKFHFSGFVICCLALMAYNVIEDQIDFESNECVINDYENAGHIRRLLFERQLHILNYCISPKKAPDA